MTAYFDNVGTRINDLLRLFSAKPKAEQGAYDAEAQEAIDVIEREVVRDVTWCAESPGCPPDLRDAMHAVISAVCHLA